MASFCPSGTASIFLSSWSLQNPLHEMISIEREWVLHGNINFRENWELNLKLYKIFEILFYSWNVQKNLQYVLKFNLMAILTSK